MGKRNTKTKPPEPPENRDRSKSSLEAQVPLSVSENESQRLDRELARKALEKRRVGEQPSFREAAALRRVEKQREDQARWAHYRNIPKKHWMQMSGRQQKVLNEQATRYDLPVGGPVVNLEEVCRWLHGFLVDHGDTLHAAMQGHVAQEDLKRQREQLKLDRERMAFEQEAGRLVDREELSLGLNRLAKVLRDAQQTLLTTCGEEAHLVMEEALDDFIQQLDHMNLTPPPPELPPEVSPELPPVTRSATISKAEPTSIKKRSTRKRKTTKNRNTPGR